MCTPLLLGLAGLAVSAGGVAATAVAKEKADQAQKRVVKDASKLTAKTDDKNSALLMGEVKQNSPSATASVDGVAAQQAQSAMTGRTDQALQLFGGSNGSNASANEAIANRVRASSDPRSRALGVIQGQAEGGRRRLAMADRTNADIDNNTSAAGRILGLLPQQMDVAGRSGYGLALGGQLAGAAGNGLLSTSMWSRPSGTAATGTTTLGATDLQPTYIDPYAPTVQQA